MPSAQAVAILRDGSRGTFPHRPWLARRRIRHRHHEYKRHGTLSLLAGIDLLTDTEHRHAEEHHSSHEFVGFAKLLDTAYPADTAIKLISDNHSAHISRETNAWLATRTEGRFTLVFTPKYGPWLNLVEGFFSKMARSMLRHIWVASKEPILAYLDDVNRSSIPGPTKSARPHDRSRSEETM